MAPASTGRDNRRRTVVIKIDHTNRGICSNFILVGLRFMMVTMKLIAPRIDEIPARCREKMARSTDTPACARFPDSGGYTVHPVPTPELSADDMVNSVKEGGRSQNLMLFIRGKAMSGAEIISGTNQFPNPPIIMGITIKKIITNACAVTIEL